MKILKGLGMYWHPNEDPSGKHDCNFSYRNLQLGATLAKRLCRGGVLMVSACCIPFCIHVQSAVMSGFLVVQHAQIEKCIPRRFCIKQNNHGSGAVIYVLSSRGELREWDWTLIPRLRGRTLTPRAAAIASLLPTGLSGSILHYWVFFCNWTG